ncbi:MAG TPA: hypothetical protein VMD53_03100 [Rhizomicrobium sp.]|nr:hypothetical protein [Rhizomicrobium sp.]
MLRLFFVCAVAVSLAGCESESDFWQPVVDNAWPFADSQPAKPVAATYDDAHCAAVARERTADAKVNGYDDDLSEIVYSGTYADCAAWDKKHPDPQGN